MHRLSLALILLSALQTAFADPAAASNCAVTSVGKTPLTDLGTGFYGAFQGGLYPGGSNARPAAHQAAGLAIANSIAPVDTFGVPDAAGRVVLISIGMSNCTQEFSAFVPKANADPSKRANVHVIDCALGGQATNVIVSPTAAYWDTVYTRLRGRRSSPAQVQVVWLKEARANPSGGFPESADLLMRDLGTIVRILKQKLPNLRACYLSSRIYAGYATGVSTLNPEPYAYESGFAVKWLIEGQIAGADSLEFDPANGPVQAPWLSWGPYLWADGLTPRSDGMTWACSAFAADGTHPSASGRNIVADQLLAFFKTDDTTAPWFTNASVAVDEGAPRTVLGLSVVPNPASHSVEVALAERDGEWQVQVLDAGGRRVRWLARNVGPAARLRWDLNDRVGRRVPSGTYWVRATSGDRVLSARVLVVAR